RVREDHRKFCQAGRLSSQTSVFLFAHGPIPQEIGSIGANAKPTRGRNALADVGLRDRGTQKGPRSAGQVQKPDERPAFRRRRKASQEIREISRALMGGLSSMNSNPSGFSAAASRVMARAASSG